MTRIKKRNVYRFLRRFAKDISFENLELMPNHLQGGTSVVFYYQENYILKIAKGKGSRVALLKEAKLLEYLNTQKLPVVVAKPTLVHDKGFYAVYSRIHGHRMSPKTLEGFAPKEQEAFARSMGAFLSFLHDHKFPDDVMKYVPQAEDPFEVQLKRTKKKIQFVKEHSAEVDITRWEEKLEGLQDSLDQTWIVTHCDLRLGHLYSIQGGAERLAVIDFASAQMHDLAVDLSEFAIELHSDLPEDGLLAGKIMDMVLKHYQTDDPAIAEKIEFGLLEFEIRRAYQQVRNSLRSKIRSDFELYS